MPSKILNVLRRIFGRKTKTALPKPFDFEPWLSNSSEGTFTEGLVGPYHCPNCKNRMTVYRQVQRLANGELKDTLRFEQDVAKGDGRNVMYLTVTFNNEVMKPTDGQVLDRCKHGANGKMYNVLKERFFGTVECVGCKENLHFWDRVVMFDGETKKRWFLSRKIAKDKIELDYED